MSETLFELFHTYFQLLPADTEELKREAYRLRYQVYCLEMGFESCDDYPDGLEKDAFDDGALHFLVRHRQSGEIAGTTRLIFADPRDPESRLPLERHCVIGRRDLIQGLSKQRVAEVSRFCVSKSFKRRHGESGTISGSHASLASPPEVMTAERRVFPHITLGLVGAFLRMSADAEVTHLYAIMEPALIRFFARLGVNFITLGPAIEYHGLRMPCVIKVSDVWAGVKRKNRWLFDFLASIQDLGSNHPQADSMDRRCA